MNTSEATRKFCQVAGIEFDSKIGDTVYKMITEEANFENSQDKKQSYEDSIENAVNRMIVWYQSASDYHFTSAHDFISTRRRTCAWTVLFAKKI